MGFWIPRSPNSPKEARWFVCCSVLNIILPGLGILLLENRIANVINAAIQFCTAPFILGFILALTDSFQLLCVGLGALGGPLPHEVLIPVKVCPFRPSVSAVFIEQTNSQIKN